MSEQTEISESMATSVIEDSSSVVEADKDVQIKQKIEVKEEQIEEITEISLISLQNTPKSASINTSLDIVNGMPSSRTSEPIMNSNSPHKSVPLHSKFNMQPELGGSVPGISSTKSPKHVKNESEETIEIEDDTKFEVRVPKRKRVKEKSLLHFHALDYAKSTKD